MNKQTCWQSPHSICVMSETCKEQDFYSLDNKWMGTCQSSDLARGEKNILQV